MYLGIIEAHFSFIYGINKGTNYVTRLFLPIMIFVGVSVFGLKATKSGKHMPQTSPFQEIIKSNDPWYHQIYATPYQNAVT